MARLKVEPYSHGMVFDDTYYIGSRVGGRIYLLSHEKLTSLLVGLARLTPDRLHWFEPLRHKTVYISPRDKAIARALIDGTNPRHRIREITRLEDSEYIVYTDISRSGIRADVYEAIVSARRRFRNADLCVETLTNGGKALVLRDGKGKLLLYSTGFEYPLTEPSESETPCHAFVSSDA